MTLPEYQDDPEWPFVKGFSNAPEVTEPVTCDVTGDMPHWLNGILYRAGPGIFDMEMHKGTSKERVVSFNHWFDGLSLVHRFEINGNTVTYRNKYVCDYQAGFESTGDKNFTFDTITDPCDSFFQKIFTRFVGKANNKANINVTISHRVNVGSTSLADDGVLEAVVKTDGNMLLPFDGKTLEPKKMFTYTAINPDFKGLLSAAHEEYDEETGEYFNFVTNPGSSTTYTVFELSKAYPSGRVLGQWKEPAIHYMHSFTSTKQYVIMMLWPCILNPLPFLWKRDFVSGLYFDKSKPTKFVVMDRKKAEIVGIYESDAFYCFHTVNAFDDEATGDVLIDLAAYPDIASIHGLRLKSLRQIYETKEKVPSSWMPTLHRFRLKNVKAASPSVKQRAELEFKVDNIFFELPRINPSFRHKSHRFIYGISENFPEGRLHSFVDSLVKLDVQTKTAIYWSKKGNTPGEPIFIPAPDAKGEDDGVLLSVVLDGTLNRSYLLVLDAKNMKELCKATLPNVVPYGFHGSFVSTM